ncbi:MAG: T9SS type A sorting domain-containing protein [Bacteroidota bacterium]
MKKFKLLSLLTMILLFGNKSQAQVSTFSEQLDVNLFNIKHMVHGDMWYDPASSQPACEYPKGSGKHASYMASIWMSGMDDLGKLHLSAQLFSSVGIDYFPGPLDASGSISSSASTDWAKIWKVDASTISNFKSLFATGGAAAITAAKFDVIKQWPASGNVDAKGNAGASLPQLLLAGVATQDFAPFVDVNGDGKYNWKDGDYPNIKGDQMLWWVFNDNGPSRTASKGLPLKIQYNAMAYGYSRGTDVDRIVFYEFTMFNKSTERYSDFRFGLFSDADLGNPFDDYIAFDSSHRMGIEYNAVMPDGANGANSYGSHPPITGLSFVEMPGDVYPSALLAAGSFTYFRNESGTPTRNPRVDTEYNNYMHAKNADGIPMAAGKYVFPISGGAEMCDKKMPPGDQRYVIASGDYIFQPGTKTKIAMAFMATDTLGYTCPISSFKPITDLADTAWKVYWNPLPLSVSEKELASKAFKLYPNPAESVLFVETLGKANKDESIRIIDALGKTIQLPMSKNNQQYEINISTLAAGIYSIVYFDGMQIMTQHFVKE